MATPFLKNAGLNQVVHEVLEGGKVVAADPKALSSMDVFQDVIDKEGAGGRGIALA